MRITCILLFLLSVACFITAVSYGQTTVAKFAIGVPKNVSQTVISQKMQKAKDTINSFNASIKDLKKDSTPKKVAQLSDQLNNSFLKKINKKVAALAATLDSMNNGQKKRVSDLDTIDAHIDTTTIELADTTANPKEDGTGEAQAVAGCSNLASIRQMIEEKQDDGSYLFSLVDKNGNALSTFILQQFNEELFNSKIKDAVYGVCNDMNAEDIKQADTIIGNIKAEGLYKRLLEASLEVNNDQDPAGTLIIHKYINTKIPNPNYIKPSKSDTTKKKARTYNSATPGTSAILLIHTGREQNDIKIVANPSSASSSIFSNANFVYESDNSTITETGNSNQKPEDEFSADADPADTSGNLKLINTTFMVYSIQIQFQDGFIENIMVLGKVPNNPHLLKYENSYPIPFSTKNNYKNLFGIRIFEKTIYSNKDSVYLLLGDIINYNQQSALDNKDYSPANKVYQNNKITDSETIVTLYKEQTSKILEMKVYSDLKGVNANNPNGLIQFEVSKKLNFWSKRFPIGTGKFINYGAFNYIVPCLSVNKIEDKEKRLVVNHIDNATPQSNQNIPLRYASTIDIFSHQNFNLGFDFSAFLVDVPSLKSTFNFGPYFYYGNVPVQDTLREKKVKDDGTITFPPIADNNVNDYDINTFYWGAFAHWQIFPNPKYGITITGRIMDFKALTRKFLQVKDSINYETFITEQKGDDSKYDNYSYHRTLVSTEIYAFFKPSENNKLFFRSRFTKDMNDAKNPYRQIQIGYSTYLTKTKEIKKKNN